MGVVVSTREGDSDRTIGLLLNTLPLTLTARAEDSLIAVCRRTEPLLTEAFAHRHYPLTSILRDRRHANRSSAVPKIMFVYESVVAPSLKDHRVSHRIVASGVSIADLTVFVHHYGDRIELAAEYSGARFDERDVVQLLRVFEQILINAVRHPDHAIGSYVLGETPAGGPAIASTTNVVETIYEVAQRQPGAVAVSSGTTELTYGDLVARAERAAAAMRSRGIGRGDRVALVMSRSPDFFVAMLGALISGACYVPIDPEYPPGRIRELLARGRAAIAVVDHGADMVNAVDIGSLEATVAPPVGFSPQPQDIAYVIFTSGSTGHPKGVAVTHENLAASTAARVAFYGDVAPRYLLASSFGFDSSVAGIYWTLTTGGELVVPTAAQQHDGDDMADLIREQQVSHLLMVPSLYEAILRRRPEALAAIRTAIVAGEACTTSLVGSPHHRTVPNAELFTEYGPTEATVWATVHRCVVTEDPVPIGRPIPGAVVAIVDSSLRPRPTGVLGELVIGGRQVAFGYIDDDDATAERFVELAGIGRVYRKRRPLSHEPRWSYRVLRSR